MPLVPPAGPHSSIPCGRRAQQGRRAPLPGWGPPRPRPSRAISMKKLLGLVGSTVGGSIGWWLGAFVGTMTAFMVSMIGTGVGLYAGLWVVRQYLE
jgi:hypothetical protein